MNERGQTLASVVMIMILALTVGVAVSTRFAQNLRSSGRTDSSSRALSIAEAAIERLLTEEYDTLVDYINYSSCGANCTLTISDPLGVNAVANVTLNFAGNSSDPFEVNLSQNDIVQVSLQGYTDGADVQICWDNPSSGELPSVTGSFLYGTDGNYAIEAFAVNSIGTLYSENGFGDAVAQAGYQNCTTLPGHTDPLALRIKSVYNDVEAFVLPTGGNNLPSQGILLTSVGQVEDVARTVEVLLSDPFVPVSFDYVLYSKSDSSPLSN